MEKRAVNFCGKWTCCGYELFLKFVVGLASGGDLPIQITEK